MTHSALYFLCISFFFFKQKTAYEMRISDWSSDVCSSDLLDVLESPHRIRYSAQIGEVREMYSNSIGKAIMAQLPVEERHALYAKMSMKKHTPATLTTRRDLDADIEKSLKRGRSEEHTSELQSLMRNSYAVFCLKKKKTY